MRRTIDDNTRQSVYQAFQSGKSKADIRREYNLAYKTIDKIVGIETNAKKKNSRLAVLGLLAVLNQNRSKNK